jgi:hypothetical protein
VVANGVTGPDFPVLVVGLWPRLLNSCDSIFGPQASSTCHPLITHADGSLVSVTDSSPARVGETITLYAVGLGGALAPTGSAPSTPQQLSATLGEVDFEYNYPVPSPTMVGILAATSAVSQTVVLPQWAGLIPGYVGLYQVNVTVPPAPAQSYLACGSIGNALVSLLQLSSGTLAICVQP